MDHAIRDILYIVDYLKQKKDYRRLNNFLTVLTELKEKSVYCNGYPVWLTIDPTNICTLKCPFCSTGAGLIKRPKGMMGIGDFKKIMDILGPYLLHIDMQNWGEPLLNKDIYQMIAYAKQFDINIALSTNFQNFDEKSAEDMINSGLDRLLLSIDGASPETYEKHRRGGSFLKAIENINILIDKKKQFQSLLPHVIWQFLVFRHNEHEIETVKKMAEKLGVDVVGINSAFIAVDSPEYKDWIPLDRKYSRYDLSDTPKTIVGSESFLKPSSEAVCNWLWEGVAINWDGTVSPCCGVYLEEEDFGNILGELKFQQLWNNHHYRTAREFMRDRNKKEQGIKNTCISCNKVGQINVELNRDFWAQSSKEYLAWKSTHKVWDSK
jgi:radical SAM protein with 4Fe4S-binding SPASM domain